MKDYTDAQLQAELERRKAERESEVAAERKSREIVVECPACFGTGNTGELSAAGTMMACNYCNERGWYVGHIPKK